MIDIARCPNDEELAQLAYGRLYGDQLVAVERHVDKCTVCRKLLAVVSNGSAPMLHPERAALQPGEKLGRYEIERLIAAGGMGMLYIAKDPQLGRRVALKLMRPAYGGDVGRLRLLREAQAMAALSHPNVLAVYELGEHDAKVFVAMELVEGGTLRDWMKQPRGTWKDTVAMFVAAGQGLAAAHQSGVIHRDFKPENVLVGRDGRPRVCDFGLSRPEVVAEEEPPRSLPMKVTQTGTMLGTPAYMSPEQLAGRRADARSDQYSFCVSLYEALAGQRPFPADTLEELRARVSGGMPPPPKDGLVPAHVWAAIARGLHPDPAQRFPDMEALLTVLGAGAPAAPKRRETAFVTALVAGLVGLATIGGGILVARDAAREPVLVPVPPPRPPAPEAFFLPAELQLEAGDRTIIELPGVQRVAVTDPGLCGVEKLPDGRLAFNAGNRAGATTLDAWSVHGQHTATRIRVTKEALPDLPESVELAPGEKKSLMLPGVTRIAVGDASICDVRAMGNDELLFTAVAPGRTSLIVWLADRRTASIITVTGKKPPPPLPRLREDITLTLGEQTVLELPGIERVAVGDSSIVDIKTIGNDKVLLIGGGLGTTTLIVWAKGGRVSPVVHVVAGPKQVDLELGKETVLSVPRLQRIAVGDARIAEVRALGDSRIRITPVSPGRTTLLAWTKDGTRGEWTLRVSASAAVPLVKANIELELGKQRTLEVPGVERIAVGDSAIVDARLKSDDGVELTGVALGTTTLLLWKKDGTRTSYKLRVGPPQQPARDEPPTGFLTIVTRPWGTVTLDGDEIGVTPIAKHTLAPGKHEVKVRTESGASATRTVDVKAGETTLLSLDLK